MTNSRFTPNTKTTLHGCSISFLFTKKTLDLSSLVNVSWLKKKPHTFLCSHMHTLFCFFFLSLHFINPSLTNSHELFAFQKFCRENSTLSLFLHYLSSESSSFFLYRFHAQFYDRFPCCIVKSLSAKAVKTFTTLSIYKTSISIPKWKKNILLFCQVIPITYLTSLPILVKE